MASKPTGFAINHHFTQMYNNLTEEDKLGHAFEQLRSRAGEMGLFPMTLTPATFLPPMGGSVQPSVWKQDFSRLVSHNVSL